MPTYQYTQVHLLDLFGDLQNTPQIDLSMQY